MHTTGYCKQVFIAKIISVTPRGECLSGASHYWQPHSSMHVSDLNWPMLISGSMMNEQDCAFYVGVSLHNFSAVKTRLICVK